MIKAIARFEIIKPEENHILKFNKLTELTLLAECSLSVITTVALAWRNNEEKYLERKNN